ncbi:MAG TPA: hypothetical protein VFS21_06130 [Roseiflexaceae bacterium]|nr:hypothetical protein [Roseiflexaceae bacterium]
MSYSAAEIAAYGQMQARLVTLLLRHDERSYGAYYQPSTNPGDRDAALEPYRRLAVLFALRDELLEHILPRIVRRLSFESPRETVVEEPPPRGRVDWERTLDATWAERPGQPPLELHTRQRRRDFATPENLLAVVTLLEFAADARMLLWGEHAAVGPEALRHPLGEIVERCERELAFPQFAGMRPAAQRVIEQDGTAALEAEVAERLIPGGNSAYEELLAWRARWRDTRLFQRGAADVSSAVLGANRKRDNYLYQLWLYYELADLLTRQRAVQGWDRATTRLTFRWGQGEGARVYTLQHDRGIPDDLRVWRGGPGVRPDLYIARAERAVVRDDDGAAIWREPGFMLDAKYHRPREDEDRGDGGDEAGAHTPTEPIKRMIADLHLSGERHGALLFAFYGGAPDAHRSVAPEQRKAQLVAPDVSVGLHQIRPQGAGDVAALERLLCDLLDTVHTRLKGNAAPRCHGVFLDTLTANAHGVLAAQASLPARGGGALPDDPADLLLCPKPHIAPWRVDIVSHSRDCCANAALCHIKHQPGVQKPQRLTALEQIASAIRQAGADGDDTQLADAATRQVLLVTKRYAELLQPRMADYRALLRALLDLDDFDTHPLLGEPQRETLALGRFLWAQIEQIGAANFAGPALLFTGVLEDLARGTVYRHSPPLTGANGRSLMPTLGVLGNSKGFGGNNWRTLELAIVGGQHWEEQITPRQRLPFSDWIDQVLQVSLIRNNAAHSANASTADFQTLVGLCFGGARTGMGVLNGLLLAWRG